MRKPAKPRNSHLAANVAVSVTLLLLASEFAAAATEVTACGQTFSGSGFLAADLDCTGFVGNAVTIDGGTLDLRGFTLTGGTQNGVACARNCTVLSDPPGGRIDGAGGGVSVFGDDLVPLAPFVNVRISDVELDGHLAGASATGRLTLYDSTVSNPSDPFAELSGSSVKLVRTNVASLPGRVVGDRVRIIDSLLAACGTTECLNGRVTVRNSTVSGSGDAGIRGTQVSVIDSSVTGNAGSGVAFFGGPERLRVVRSGITANGGRGISGESAGRVVIKDSDVSGNALEGIFELDVISIEGSTITNNGRSGVSTGSTAVFSLCDVRISDSTFSGNGTDLAVCGVSETCADIATCGQAPDLQGTTTCETSYDTDSGFPGTSWGVCSLD